MALLSTVIRRGTRAAQPLATAVSTGTLYFVTDEGKVERSSGSAWETFSGSGSGTVTTTGTPASGNLAKFSGATSIVNADLTGDVTTSGGVATTIANDAVSYAKMQNVSAASKLIGRGDSGAGDPQEIALGTGLSIVGTTVSRDALTGDVTTSANAATIANDAVTYAKMQNVSAASKIIGRGSASGSGDPEEITLGTNLSMSGTTLNATGGSGGALVLLEQHAASASAQLDFTTAISATYDEYLIEFVNIIPATAGASLQLTMSTDGGSTFDTAANYAWGIFVFDYNFITTTGVGAGGNSGQSNIRALHSMATTANYSTSGSMRLFNPGGSIYKSIMGDFVGRQNDGNFYRGCLTGAYLSTTAVNAFRFAMSSGNITSGTIRVYGIAKT